MGMGNRVVGRVGTSLRGIGPVLAQASTTGADEWEKKP